MNGQIREYMIEPIGGIPADDNDGFGMGTNGEFGMGDVGGMGM